MSMVAALWRVLATLIRLNDQLEHMAAGMKAQQDKIENLNARVIRLESLQEFRLSSGVIQHGQLPDRSWRP